MRLRLAMIAMSVLVLCGVFLVAHRFARAEHVRVAMLQAEAAESARPIAGGPVAAPGASAGEVRAPAVVAPPSAPTPPEAAPAVPRTIVAPAAVDAPFREAPAVQVVPGFPGAAGAGPNTPQFTPYTWYGYAHYPAPGGDDPETNELTSQDQQLEQEVQSLARQLAESEDDKQRTDLKDKLASTLEKQFDAQQKLRQLEISRIEARVQKLRDLVHKRTDSRRKIIENRLEQLLNDADGLGWNSAKGSGLQFVPHGVPGVAPVRPTAPRGLPAAVPAPARVEIRESPSPRP